MFEDKVRGIWSAPLSPACFCPSPSVLYFVFIDRVPWLTPRFLSLIVAVALEYRLNSHPATREEPSEQPGLRPGKASGIVYPHVYVHILSFFCHVRRYLFGGLTLVHANGQ